MSYAFSTPITSRNVYWGSSCGYAIKVSPDADTPTLSQNLPGRDKEYAVYPKQFEDWKRLQSHVESEGRHHAVKWQLIPFLQWSSFSHNFLWRHIRWVSQIRTFQSRLRQFQYELLRYWHVYLRMLHLPKDARLYRGYRHWCRGKSRLLAEPLGKTGLYTTANSGCPCFQLPSASNIERSVNFSSAGPS